MAEGAPGEESKIVERMEVGTVEVLRVVVTGAALEEEVEVVRPGHVGSGLNDGTALGIALPEGGPLAAGYVRSRSWDALVVVIVELGAGVAGDATGSTGPAYAAALGPGAALGGGDSRENGDRC